MTMKKLPLTHTQRMIWLGERMLVKSAVNNMAFAFDWQAVVDEVAFKAAFAALVMASDGMRMVIDQEEEIPYLRVTSEVRAPLEVLSFQSFENPAIAARDWVTTRCSTPLDTEVSLYDAALLKLADDHYVFYFNLHHFITDGWGIALQLSWLRISYDGLRGKSKNPLPELGSFANYLLSYHELEKRPKAEKSKAYWRALAEKTPEAPRLYGRSNPDLRSEATRTTRLLTGAENKSLLNLLETPEVRSFSTDLSLLTVFAAVCAAYVYRVSGERSVVIGMPFHGRLSLSDKMTPGVMMEIFPIHVEVKPEATFAQLLETSRIAVMEYLRNVFPGTSAPDQSHKCNVYLNLLNQPFEFSGEEFIESKWLHPGETEPNHHFVVKVYDFDGTGQYKLDFDLNNAVFAKDVRKSVPDQFVNVLELIMEDRSLPVGTRSLKEVRVLDAFNRQEPDFPLHETIASLFAKQVVARPDATALVMDNQRMTYAELDVKTNQMAAFLLDQGLTQHAVVGVCLDRGFDLVITLLGIIKAGMVYLPIDPEYPPGRIDFMLEDAEVAIAVCENKYADRLGELPAHRRIVINRDLKQFAGYANTSPGIEITPQRMIYIYYTSGSTGKPKGVKVQHEGVTNLLLSLQKLLPLIPERDACINKTVLTFDSAVHEVFWPLTMGARVAILPTDKQLDSDYLRDLIKREEITTNYFVPPMLEHYLKEIGEVPNVQRLICGGDELKLSTINRFWSLHPDVKFYNFYGPTEGSVGCTIGEVTSQDVAEGEITIGKPFPNANIYIIDAENKRCPVGVPGELCIGGVHTALGYLNRPELTAEKFVTLPLGPAGAGERVYRTGDLARWRTDGAIYFMGRMDDQVKIRGVRIEPEELQRVLLKSRGVKDAIVIVDEPVGEAKRLLAYVIANDNYDKEATRRYLADHLPVYLLPAEVMTLPVFPISPNGKLNRKELPRPEVTAGVEADVEMSYTDFEIMILEAWREVLGKERIGRNAHFLDLGGNSLDAIRIMTRINDTFELSLAANSIFRYPTIASISGYVEATLIKLLGEMEEN